MSTYYTVEVDVNEIFVMRNGRTVSGPHASYETAWNSAEAKAKAEAVKNGGRATYTILEGQAEACWKVGNK